MANSIRLRQFAIIRSRPKSQTVVSTKPLLYNFMEKLLRNREYLGVCTGHSIFLETCHQFLQRVSRQDNSNLSIYRLHFAYIKVYNQIQNKNFNKINIWPRHQSQ